MSPATLVALAIALWGWVRPLHYTINDGAWNAATSAAWIERYPDTCAIYLGSGFATMTFDGQLAVMVHEIGHCLGLNHDNSEPNVMTANMSDMTDRPTAHNFAVLRALTGSTTRRSLFLPMIGAN